VTASDVSLEQQCKGSGLVENPIKDTGYLETAFLIKTVHRVTINIKRFFPLVCRAHFN